jgi:hypothetical protein
MTTHSKMWKNNIHIRSEGAGGQANGARGRKSSFRKEDFDAGTSFNYLTHTFRIHAFHT